MHRVGEGNLTSEFGLDFRCSDKCLLTVSEKTLEMRADSAKFKNVSDMQVPDEDYRHDEESRSKTIKANNKIVKGRMWTLVSL